MTKMNTYEKARSVSLVTGSDNLEHLATIKKFPVFIGATDAPKSEDIKSDMVWDICKDSGCIQLRQPINPNIIYSAYHSEAIGDTWTRHHKLFQQFAEKYVQPDILEIGGSNGDMATSILNKFENIQDYTIIEPNPSCENSDKLKVISDFFSLKFCAEKIQKQYGLCVHSHTLEHAYDPIDFISATSKCVREGGYHVLSIPNLEQYMENKFTNCLNFEHTYFLTKDLLISLMSHYGFELLDVAEFEEHSLFLAFKKHSGVKSIPVTNDYEKNKALFNRYMKYHKTEVQRLNAILEASDCPVFLFGAHIFSQFLLTLGLRQKKIQSIIDNSNLKNGKRLYGTDLFIEYPNIIKTVHKPLIILKAGQYQREVEKQIQKINNRAIIIE